MLAYIGKLVNVFEISCKSYPFFYSLLLEVSSFPKLDAVVDEELTSTGKDVEWFDWQLQGFCSGHESWPILQSSTGKMPGAKQ